nr:S-layer homology domain-containing protein [Butyricicoccus sp. AF10-3]
MVWNDFFSHFSLNADGSRSYDGVQVKRNAVFADAKGHWAQNAIGNTVAEGLFSSVTDTSFAPNTSATRGMLMTVLARYAGTDTTGGATWYEKGMEWSKTNGVSDGTNPNADITREQLVTMLYRYAGSPKADGKLDSFSDFASVSSYAENAMQWAVANGIVNGSNGKLNPQNNATRAEVAAILMRFCEMRK